MYVKFLLLLYHHFYAIASTKVPSFTRFVASKPNISKFFTSSHTGIFSSSTSIQIFDCFAHSFKTALTPPLVASLKTVILLHHQSKLLLVDIVSTITFLGLNSYPYLLY